MKKNIYELSRARFNGLHRAIEAKCDEILREKGIRSGLNRKNEQHYYGFMSGENEPASVKAVVMETLRAKGHPFEGLRRDEEGRPKFNARLLAELRVEYRRYVQVMAMPHNYLHLFLDFLELEDVGALPELEDEAGTRRLKPSPPGFSSKKQEQVVNFYSEQFNRALRNIANTNWYFYEFDTKGSTGTPPAVVRNRFRIYEERSDDTGDFNAELLKMPPFGNFSGRLVYNRSNPKILIFRLSTHISSAKYMEIILHVEPTLSKDLYLGIAIRYDDNYSILANTVVLEKRVEPFEQLKTTKMPIRSEEGERELPPVLRTYFNNKLQNVIRAPTGISTWFDFEQWLHEKRREAPAAPPAVRYDLYIGCPISGLKGESGQELERIRTEIEAMRQDSALAEIGINSTYCPLCDEQFAWKEPSKILSDELERFQASKAYLLILDIAEPLQSSVFVQLGWAMQSGKPAFIICRRREHLPRLLRYANPAQKIFINAPDNPVAICNVPAWLKENGYFRYFN